MPVLILDRQIVRDPVTGLDSFWHINFEIWESGGTHYLYSKGNVPLTLTKTQAAIWLDNHFDELLAAAAAKGRVAPDSILDNPNVEWNKALIASLLVILGQVNVLRNELGLAEITEQQAYAAIKAQYRDLD